MSKALSVLLFIAISFVGFFIFDASSDYDTDYTLIDCEAGDNASGVAFDSSHPYETLGYGISETIQYINTNVNKAGNEETASGKVFEIKVNCTEIGPGEQKIILNFYGEKYNNELVISGTTNESLNIYNVYFDFPGTSGNVKFKNARFLDNSQYGYYFSWSNANTSGVKIEDSYLIIKHGTQLGSNLYMGRVGNAHLYRYNARQDISNTIIDFELKGNYEFKMPHLIKDSKINFINQLGDATYDVRFIKDWSDRANWPYDSRFKFASFVSNEIDFGGNNFTSPNLSSTAFINNKYSNYNDFTFGNNTVYVNNLFEGTGSLDISSVPQAYNNVFTGDFVNNSSNNDKKNFSIDDTGAKGLTWLHARPSTSKYLRFEFDSFSTYKEATGQDIPKENNPILLFFY